jgi:hypothetical protein
MSAKRTTIFNQGCGKQRGAALMVMLVILIIGAVTIFVSSLNSSALNIGRDQITADALAKAKEALIGYAVTYGDTHPGEVPGYLPCPDTDGNNGLQPEGSGEYGSGSPCSNAIANKNVSVLGRLPWKTIDLPPLRDGNGECLWYAVSGTYKNLFKTDRMNWDNPGLLSVSDANGVTISTNVVAVIFAPGPVTNNQDRTPSPNAPICGGNYMPASYLENDTFHGINNSTVTAGKFIQPHDHRDANGNVVLNINDQMIYITADDIFNAIKKRNDFQSASPNNVLYNMTQAAATCLASATPRLPAPSPINAVNGSVGWVPVNSSALTGCATASTWSNWWSNWGDHLFYDPSGVADVNGNAYDAVIIFANPKLSGQNRITATDKNNPANYLEGNNLPTFNTGSPDYQAPPLSSLSNTLNDVLFCVPPGLTASLCP